jgi:hypothetical protein
VAPLTTPVPAATPVEELSTLLSVATRIEPELLRAVRLGIAPHLDAGAEADFWFSDVASVRSPRMVSISPAFLSDLRQALAERIAASGPSDPVHRLGDIVAGVHAALPPALVLEERIAWLSVSTPDPDEAQIDRALRSALRALVQQDQVGLVDWFAGAWERLPDIARRTRTSWQLVQVVTQRRRAVGEGWRSRGGSEPAPSTLSLPDVAMIGDELPDVRLAVSRSGTGITIAPAGAGDRMVLPVPDTSPRLALLTEAERPAADRTIIIPAGEVVRVTSGRGALRLVSARGDILDLPAVEPPPASRRTDTGADLGSRLRGLRQGSWPDRRVTQAQLAVALAGDEQPFSVALISSWETGHRVPPPSRLEAYATFFATRRSIAGPRPRLLQPGELTADELVARSRILDELNALRAAALSEPEAPRAEVRAEIGNGALFFPDRATVTIVNGRAPNEILEIFPDPNHPAYVEMRRYANPDALLELHGHARAMNPASSVPFKLHDDLVADDYTTHLVLLGASDMLDELLDVSDVLPIRFREPGDGRGGLVTIDADGGHREFAPVIRNETSGPALERDIAVIARAQSPFNHNRTVTLLAGVHARGTLAAVRALTDPRFRDRNNEFLAERFRNARAFVMVARVEVRSGKVLTPDLTVAHTRLFEWESDR